MCSFRSISACSCNDGQPCQSVFPDNISLGPCQSYVQDCLADPCNYIDNEYNDGSYPINETHYTSAGVRGVICTVFYVDWFYTCLPINPPPDGCAPPSPPPPPATPPPVPTDCINGGSGQSD